MKVGIIGGAGYTAGELIRILIYHPNVEIKFVHSTSNANNPITTVHRNLIGESDFVFTDNEDFNSVDVVFLCLGHGESKKYLEKNDIPTNVKIIDLSQDFRIKNDSHNFVYGLPEANREQIKLANRIANPGCFATAIQLAALPLFSHSLITDDLHITGITGSTGNGQKLVDTVHFSWRTNNISVYKPFEHQHLNEITQTFKEFQPEFKKQINFIPIRGNFTRGIFVTCYTKCELDINRLHELYETYYKSHPFVYICNETVDLKLVVNTNKCFLQVEKVDDKIFITSVIDNLIKGASGQAVQNMNLMFGIDEKSGLNLKPVAF